MAEMERDGPITTIQGLDSCTHPIKIKKQRRWAVKRLMMSSCDFGIYPEHLANTQLLLMNTWQAPTITLLGSSQSGAARKLKCSWKVSH